MGSLLAHDASQCRGRNFPATTQAAGDHCLIAFDHQDLNNAVVPAEGTMQGDGVVRIEGCGFHFLDSPLIVDCVCHCLIISFIGSIASLS